VLLRPQHAPGELLAFLEPAPPDGSPRISFLEERAKLLEVLDASIVREYPELKAALIRFGSPIDGAELEERKQKIASNPKFFRSPQFNQIVVPAQPAPAPTGTLPNDFDPTLQWGLDRVHVQAAWARTTGSKMVLVGVVDSGIALAHPDLGANLWVNRCEIPKDGIDNGCFGLCGNGYPDDVNGWNFLDRNGNPDDDYGHGTQVAGVIAAVTDNGQGIAGVSWHVSLVALKFYSMQVAGKVSDAAEAIVYAASLPVDVINASWKVPLYDEYLYQALDYARARGVLVVAAAGRGDASGVDLDQYPNYPCSYKLENVICVTATDDQNQLGSLSSWGATTVDLGAPGERILSTVTGPLGYDYGHSSSMAAPHVAGVAALIRAKCPMWGPKKIRDVIRQHVKSLPSLSQTISGGLLDATDVVPISTSACGPPAPEPTPATQ